MKEGLVFLYPQENLVDEKMAIQLVILLFCYFVFVLNISREV